MAGIDDDADDIRFCKKLMGIPNCEGLAKMELGRESRRENCVGRIVRYWYQIMCCDVKDLVKQCYEWQKRNGVGEVGLWS